MNIHQALISEFQLYIQGTIVMLLFQVYQHFQTNFLVYNFILAEYSTGDLNPNPVIILRLGSRQSLWRSERRSRVLPHFRVWTWLHYIPPREETSGRGSSRGEAQAPYPTSGW